MTDTYLQITSIHYAFSDSIRLCFSSYWVRSGPINAEAKTGRYAAPRLVYVHVTHGEYEKIFSANELIINAGDGVMLVGTGRDTKDNIDNTRQLLQWVADSLRQPSDIRNTVRRLG